MILLRQKTVEGNMVGRYLELHCKIGAWFHSARMKHLANKIKDIDPGSVSRNPVDKTAGSLVTPSTASSPFYPPILRICRAHSFHYLPEGCKE